VRREEGRGVQVRNEEARRLQVRREEGRGVQVRNEEARRLQVRREKGEACKCGMKSRGREAGAARTCRGEVDCRQPLDRGSLTALETQQAEILRLLKSGAKPDHQNRGGKGPHHGERNAEHEDRD